MGWLTWLMAMSMTITYSDRTAIIQPNPSDYEYSFSIHKPKIYHLEIEQMRKDGMCYNDKEVWIENTFFGWLYVNEKVVKKESRNINYNQFDCRYKYKLFTTGYTLRHNDFGSPKHNLSLGLNLADFHFNIGIADVEVISKTDFISNFSENAISSYNQISFQVLTNVSISFLYKYEYIRGKLPFEQKKIGITYKIPMKKKE